MQSASHTVGAQQMVAVIIIIQYSILGGYSRLWRCVNTLVTIQPLMMPQGLPPGSLTNYHPLHTCALVYLHKHVNTLTDSLDKYLLSTYYGSGTTGCEDKKRHDRSFQSSWRAREVNRQLPHGARTEISQVTVGSQRRTIHSEFSTQASLLYGSLPSLSPWLQPDLIKPYVLSH